ncbi:Dabb family protein [Mariniradius saccharolyticus]|nr:Dabb family protein [Mariniradius saccharolyticus]
MKTRRKFIQTLAVASVATALPIELMAEQSKKQKMIHQVFFWLKPGEDVKDFLKEASVLGKCKTVAKSYMGVPAPTEARDVVDHSYQVACTLFFDSIEDQNIYQTDPEHLKFIERNSNKWASVKVYDFVV